METPIHNLTALFDQLGLPSDASAIDQFIARHRPIPAETALHQAPCWNPSQAEFLQQMTADDADWAAIIDQLDALLR